MSAELQQKRPTDAPMPRLEGKGKGQLGFEELDQHYQIKIRSMIKLCMPPIFGALDRQFAVNSMRAEGTIPVMFYLEFESYPQPLAFNGRQEVDYQVALKRSVTPAPPERGGSPVQRLLFDMHMDLSAEEGSGDPQLLGGGTSSGRMVPAGRMRGVHVITRPVAPPDQRQVIDVPAQLRGLAEQPWDEPFPAIETLAQAPAGFAEVEVGTAVEQQSVWALHNTDINQHVNVHEYITALENHFARQLFAAKLPVARHHIARTDILFRKPSFMGEAHGARGRLFVAGERTVFLGGVHRVQADGTLDPRPSVFARMHGKLNPAG